MLGSPLIWFMVPFRLIISVVVFSNNLLSIITGPFNTSVLTYMRLTNPTDKKILFKIKTTAPKKYCVRPNSGVLEPKNMIEVASK